MEELGNSQAFVLPLVRAEFLLSFGRLLFHEWQQQQQRSGPFADPVCRQACILRGFLDWAFCGTL